MAYATLADLPSAVREALPTAAQHVYRAAFNNALTEYDDESKAHATAWAAVKRGWNKNDAGEWVKTSKALLCKIDAARHLVFGWANVCVRKNGEQIEDCQGDLIDPPDLEDAAYAFVLNFGEAGAEHQGETTGHLVESLVVTKEKLAAMGLPEDALPQGWWIGFHVPDSAVWAKVAAGEYTMFSIQGEGVREAV